MFKSTLKWTIGAPVGTKGHPSEEAGPSPYFTPYQGDVQAWFACLRSLSTIVYADKDQGHGSKARTMVLGHHLNVTYDSTTKQWLTPSHRQHGINEIHFVGIDIDGCPPENLCALLNKLQDLQLAFFWHPTYSGIEKFETSARVHLFLPLATPVTSTKWKVFVASACHWLRSLVPGQTLGIEDSRSLVWSTKWVLFSAPNNEAKETLDSLRDNFFVDGNLLDPNIVPTKLHVVEAKAKHVTLDDFREVVARRVDSWRKSSELQKIKWAKVGHAILKGDLYGEPGDRRDKLRDFIWFLLNDKFLKGSCPPPEESVLLFEASVQANKLKYPTDPGPDLPEIQAMIKGALEKIADEEIPELKNRQDIIDNIVLRIRDAWPAAESISDRYMDHPDVMQQMCASDGVPPDLFQQHAILVGPGKNQHAIWTQQHGFVDLFPSHFEVMKHWLIPHGIERDFKTRKYPLLNDLITDHGTRVHEYVYNSTIKRNEYKRSTRAGKECHSFHVAACIPRDLEPKYDERVAMILDCLGRTEDEHNRLLDWLTIAPDLSKCLSILMLFGDRHTYKSSALEFLVRIWGDKWLDFADNYSFNEERLHMPVIVADEADFGDLDQRKIDITKKLRRIPEGTQTVKEKFRNNMRMIGHSRVAVIANNPEQVGLNTRRLDHASQQALAERFCVVWTDTEKAAKLYKLLPQAQYDAELRYSTVGAQHILWLAQERTSQVPNTGRFYCAGGAAEEKMLVEYNNHNNSVLACIVKGCAVLANSKKDGSQQADRWAEFQIGKHKGQPSLVLSQHWVEYNWSKLMIEQSKPQWIFKIMKAFIKHENGKLCERQIPHLATGARRRVYEIDLDALMRMATDMGYDDVVKELLSGEKQPVRKG